MDTAIHTVRPEYRHLCHSHSGQHWNRHYCQAGSRYSSDIQYYGNSLVHNIDQSWSALCGMDRSADSGHTVRQIANAHTGFNVINTIITLPVAGYLPLLASKLVPGEEPEQEEMRLKFLDKRILETPPIAVAQIMNEVGRMADIAQKNLEEAMDMVISKDDSKKKDVLQREEVLNFLNREITSYLVEANGLELPEKDLQLIGGLFHVVNDIERIGDHSENIIEYAEYLIEHNLTMSDMAIEELTMMKDKVMTVVNDTIKGIEEQRQGFGQDHQEQGISH